MGWRRGILAIWLVGLLVVGAQGAVRLAGAQDQTESQVGWVMQDFAAVRAGPGLDFPVVWRLYERSQVVALGDQVDAKGTAWREVGFWNSQTGWLEADLVTFEPPPSPAQPNTGQGGPGACQPAAAGSAVQSLAALGMTTQVTPLGNEPDSMSARATLGSGREVGVDAWQVGEDGRVRYHVQAGLTAGWAAPGSVALRSADAASRRVGGRPVVAPLAGIGLWFTLDDRQHGIQRASGWPRPPGRLA